MSQKQILRNRLTLEGVASFVFGVTLLIGVAFICVYFFGFHAALGADTPGSQRSVSGMSVLLGAAVWCYAAAKLLMYRQRADTFLRDHSAALKRWAELQHVSYMDEREAATLGETYFIDTSLLKLFEGVIRYRDVINAPTWRYATGVAWDYGHPTKGNNHSNETFVAILRLDLPRALPHVFFDSKKMDGQQYDIAFNTKQQHSLEGDFDKYFTAYFIEEYTIDSLSFIAPDVMQKMVEASDYDIEIINNHLYLYGPLEKGEQAIQIMFQRAGAIVEALGTSLRTYRDERLPLPEGRMAVSKTGQHLKQHVMTAKEWAIFIAIFIIMLVL